MAGLRGPASSSNTQAGRRVEQRALRLTALKRESAWAGPINGREGAEALVEDDGVCDGRENGLGSSNLALDRRRSRPRHAHLLQAPPLGWRAARSGRLGARA